MDPYGRSLTTGYEVAKSIRQTSDGGYIIAGWTDSSGAGGKDFLVLKVSSTGTYQWAKTYGGVHSDEAHSIDVAADNGYFVAGYSRTSATDASKDFLILKLSSIGNIQWQKTFGHSDDQIAYSVQTTSDGGCVLTGSDRYSDNVSPDHFYVIKLSSAGAVQWQKIFNPDDGTQGANSIQQTSDGGYVVAGICYQKFLVAKLSSAGTIPNCPNIWDYDLGNPFASISTGVQSVAEVSASLSVGNPSVAVADVAVTRDAHCTLGGACAGQ